MVTWPTAKEARLLRAQVLPPPLPLTSCVASAEFLNHSEHQFLHLESRKKYSDLPPGEGVEL